MKKIDRIKQLLKSQEAKAQKQQRRGIKTRNPDDKNIGLTIAQIKGASYRHKRLRFIAKKSDEHFQLMIYLHGFKTALEHRKHDLKKLEKNLHYIDHLGNKIERYFNKVDERNAQLVREGTPVKQPPKQTKPKDPKMEKAKLRRSRSRKLPF